MYKVQVTPLIGLPRFDGWAHVTTISSGNVVFAISVEGQHARNIGRDLVDLINQDTAISSGAQLYTLVTKIVQDCSDKEGKLSLACGYLVQEAKSTFCVFNGSVTLKRDGKSGQLLQSSDQLQIIEGKTQLEDSYVFATSQANQFLGEVKQKFDQGFDADTIVTSITPSLHLEETTATSAMAFVDFRDAAQVPIQKQAEVLIPDVPEPTDIPDVVKKESVPEKSIEPDIDWLASMSEISDPPQKKIDEVSQKLTIQPLEQDTVSKKVTIDFKKLKPIFSTLVNNVKKIASWRPPVSGEVYVGKAAANKKVRVGAGIAVIVLLIILASGLFLYQRNQKATNAAAMLEPFLSQIQQVNAKVEENPIESRQKLQQIISEMESLEAGLENDSVAQKRVSKSLVDARKLYDEISGKEVFSELPIFFNSRDQELDILITNSEIIDDQFVFFDRQKKEGLITSAQGEVQSSFSAQNIDTNIRDISVEFGLETVWLLSEKIFSLDPTTDATPSEEVESERLDQSSMLAAFGNSLYVFNAEERTIFKFTQDDDGFTESTRWVRSVPGLDFEQIIDMMIDGDVWLTSKTGEIFRLRSGNRQDFSFSGLEKPFTSSVYLYSQEELENIYFLEPAESRVVISDKDGVFIREVTSSSLAAASHIIVSTDETKLLAVSGSTVYLIEL